MWPLRQVEVLLHPDLHRISTIFYEQHSTLHWHCYSIFVGELCFTREINLIDQDQAQPTKSKSKSKQDAAKVCDNAFHPTMHHG